MRGCSDTWKLLFQLAVINTLTQAGEVTWELGGLAALPEDSCQVAHPTGVPIETSGLSRYHSSHGIQTHGCTHIHIIEKKNL